VCQRTLDEVGEHDRGDRVASAGDIGLGGRLGAVGEKRVMAPEREQRVLVVAVRTRRTISLAVTGLAVLVKATSASEISSPVSGSVTAPGSANSTLQRLDGDLANHHERDHYQRDPVVSQARPQYPQDAEHQTAAANVGCREPLVEDSGGTRGFPTRRIEHLWASRR
jgi:hypothetical protein